MRSLAASTIREARMRSEMTQAQLAAAAGISQSVVSAYESSKREPSVRMLQKLVAATGLELAVTLAASPRRAAVIRNSFELVRVLGDLGATNVRLFGSVARGDDSESSDVDLLVDLKADAGLFALGRMRAEAERLLEMKVDLVPSNSLKTEMAERILAEAVPL